MKTGHGPWNEGDKAERKEVIGMFTRYAHVHLAAILVVTLMFGGIFTARAQAGDTGRILAGLAAGALVYSALDHDDDPGYDRYHHHRYTPDPHRRYDPPRRYQYHYETPRETYDRGYDDGWRDGYDYGEENGRRQGYRHGYDRGYDHGYGDGRHDQWKADHYIGRPYHRRADKAYGHGW